jgi:hypothetical protein
MYRMTYATYISDTYYIHKQTTCYHIGTFTIPFETLRDPPEYLRIRDVKEWYVDHLMGMLSQELDDHEDLTAPMLVVSSVPKQQFKQKELNKYTYQVRILSISYYYCSSGVHLLIYY